MNVIYWPLYFMLVLKKYTSRRVPAYYSTSTTWEAVGASPRSPKLDFV